MRFTLAVRAILSFSAGLVITFAQSHSAAVGILTFSSYLVALGVLVSFMNLVSHKTPTSLQEVAATLFALLLGVLGFMIPLDQGAATVTALVWLVASWGLVGGALELYSAYLAGWRSPLGRDRSLSGFLALVLGALYLSGTLDEIASVGFVGAYLVLTAVHFGIAAASPRKNV